MMTCKDRVPSAADDDDDDDSLIVCDPFLDHDDIIYSPFLFTVRCDLEQSASGSRQLPLPPPGLSHNELKNER